MDKRRSTVSSSVHANNQGIVEELKKAELGTISEFFKPFPSHSFSMF
jgi:hypothetical protein